MTVLRLLLAGSCLFVLFVPAWWLAGRLQGPAARPFFRGLVGLGLSIIGYVSFVNLLGRLISQSIPPALIYFTGHAVLAGVLWRRRPTEVTLGPLFTTWRDWVGWLVLAIVMGVPQWILAVSTPYWDEVASSAIHLTAVNQFAENVFPPRHNALPDIAIKYHYGVTLLSGTVAWLGGLSANVSVDATSTLLWVFAFLFVCFWLRETGFDRATSFWGGSATLLGGGLGWLYLGRTEAYSGVDKLPPASALLHRYDASKTWLDNLIAVGEVPSAHLRNADGSLSNLPWDISAQFQQHATALGIALTPVALYLFVTWQKQKNFHRPLLLANIVAFSVLFLAHAVFGGVTAVTAGLYLLGAWLRERTRVRFQQGLAFGIGVSVVALLHGGLLATGSQYGSTSDVLTLRRGFGYSAGGVSGFLDWNLAGFGLPLLLAVAAWVLYLRRKGKRAGDHNLLFVVLSIFAAFSYVLPQLAYYTTETSRVEQYTEISKFFFTAHFGFALLSAFAIGWLPKSIRGWVIAPGVVAMTVTPLAFCYASAVNADGSWLGFYQSPYQGAMERRMGATLRELKTSKRDVYFDAAADEFKNGYLSEMLVYGGSVFTLTPTRYERTGIGYRLSEALVAQRYVQNGRMARLLPGAPAGCDCSWYYARPADDLALAPMIVRARFDKLVAEGYFTKRLEMGPRTLYSIAKPTDDLDRGIEKYWRPRIVSQTRADWDGDGKSDLIFFDHLNRKIISGANTIDLPPWLHGEFVQLLTARFPGETKVDFLFARMKDTDFRLGTKIEDLVQRNSWAWSYRDSHTAVWQPEYEHWFWDFDLPFVADPDRDGFDAHMAYRPRSKEWLLAPNRTMTGPAVDANQMPLPLGGRFLEPSTGDLGLWSPRTGMLTLQTIRSGRSITFKWGGRPGDVLVPGDYTGDGYDEIAVWQRTNHTWYWRRAPDGPISQATFGTETSVPLPWDYNGDGRLDLAYWEPAEGKIHVSFTLGKSIDLTVPVPADSIPAFVNMY